MAAPTATSPASAYTSSAIFEFARRFADICEQDGKGAKLAGIWVGRGAAMKMRVTRVTRNHALASLGRGKGGVRDRRESVGLGEDSRRVTPIVSDLISRRPFDVPFCPMLPDTTETHDAQLFQHLDGQLIGAGIELVLKRRHQRFVDVELGGVGGREGSSGGDTTISSAAARGSADVDGTCVRAEGCG